VRGGGGGSRGGGADLDLSLLRALADVVHLVHDVHACRKMVYKNNNFKPIKNPLPSKPPPPPPICMRTAVFNNAEGRKAHAIKPRVVTEIDKELSGARIRRAGFGEGQVATQVALDDGLVGDRLGAPLGGECRVAADSNLRHESGDDSEESAAVVVLGLNELFEARGTDWRPRRVDVDDEGGVAGWD
jgi:hypothetical protein